MQLNRNDRFKRPERERERERAGHLVGKKQLHKTQHTSGFPNPILFVSFLGIVTRVDNSIVSRTRCLVLDRRREIERDRGIDRGNAPGRYPKPAEKGNISRRIRDSRKI